MRLLPGLNLLLSIALIFTCLSQSAWSSNLEIDFSEKYERIFQIRVLSQNAQGKTAIGSGFQVDDDGLIITNYHVVSEYINAPEHFQIKYLDNNGNTGYLELLDFDIVNDLAVLQHPQPANNSFHLHSSPPEKGERVFALGNPGDWGMVMVPGPANGMVEHSLEDRVLFSGSLNGGMSGGPSVNSAGNVIGVNVATAGSQLSFLVPAAKVRQLLAQGNKVYPDSFNEEIARQIRAWQSNRIQELIDIPWTEEEFSGKALFGEIRKDFQCWGHSNDTDKERVIERVRKSCKAGDDIYVSDDLNGGQIEFSFTKLKPVKLNEMQFSRGQSSFLSSENRSSYDDSTNFSCKTNFIRNNANQLPNSEQYHRLTTCIRAYKKLPGLYDSLILLVSNSGDEIFESRLALSSVEKDHIQAMNLRFVERML